MVKSMNNELIKEVDSIIKDQIDKANVVEEYYSSKVLKAFKDNNLSETDFYGTTGYGYNDVGRDKIDTIFSQVLDSEKALVRSQFISGTHALTVTFFGLLRPGDLLLSISGKPYDTLDEVIGFIDNPSSLKSFGIKYDQIDLVNNDFDYDGIKEYLSNNKVKVIEIQRSKGYSTRSSITIDKIEKVVKVIKEIDKDVIIMVDNCYCEMVEEKTPLPDLIITDGGKGQMDVVRQVIEGELHLNIPIAGLAKNDRHRTNELLYGWPPQVIGIKTDSELFRVLTQIQDEVHRYAITFHRDKRSKHALHSELDDIKGFGPKSKELILKKLKTVKSIKEADIQKLTSILGPSKAEILYHHFHE